MATTLALHGPAALLIGPKLTGRAERSPQSCRVPRRCGLHKRLARETLHARRTICETLKVRAASAEDENAPVLEESTYNRRKKGTPGTCQNCVERAEEWQAVQATREGKVDFWIVLGGFAALVPFIGLGVGIATGYVRTP